MNDMPCTYRISIKAIIRDDKERILLIREQDGSWELPGGGIEHDETAMAALVREITEETGYTVTWMDDRPEAFWSIYKEVGSPTLKWFAFVAYAARVSGTFKPSANTNDEAHEAGYFSREQIKTPKLHDNTKPYFLESQ